MSPGVLRVTALCTLACAGTATAQQKFEYKYTKGETLAYVMTFSMQETDGNDVIKKIVQTVDIEQTTLDLIADGVKIRTRIRRARVDAEFAPPVGRIVVDSEAKTAPNDPVAKDLSDSVGRLANVEFDMVVSAIGEVKNIEFSEATAKILRSSPGGRNVSELDLKKGLEKLSHSGIVFPQKAIATGDRWERTTELGTIFGKMTSTFKFLYSGKVGTAERIDFTTDLAIPADPRAPARFKIKNQNGWGIVVFDLGKGRLHQMRMTQDMELAVDAMGAEIPCVTRYGVTVRLKSK